jgi:hypothetical protein
MRVEIFARGLMKTGQLDIMTQPLGIPTCYATGIACGEAEEADLDGDSSHSNWVGF